MHVMDRDIVTRVITHGEDNATLLQICIIYKYQK